MSTSQWRRSEQLFVCFGDKNKEAVVTKQRMSHWVIEAISAAYEAHGLCSPLGVRAHSTRDKTSSQALFKGSYLEDICVATGWSSLNTKFYGLD